MRIILGSSSPWRAEVMRDIGLKYEVVSPDVDEQSIRRKNPFDLTIALAWEKNRATRVRAGCDADPDTIVITADQVVVCDGQLREKPVDAEQARVFLRSYRTHPLQAINGVCIFSTRTAKIVAGTNSFHTRFKNLTDEAIEHLIADGTVLSCAGASAAGHPALEPYVEQMTGTWEDAYGLPASLTLKLIERVTRTPGTC